MEIAGLVDRVRSEFEEMPGLRLTIPQASRLWGLDPAACQRIVEALVRTAFLQWSAGGTVMRAS
jgi:hypothetical protein